MTFSFHPLPFLFAMVLTSISASAHEVKEMTARARVFHDRVEMVVTVSTHMATVLLANPIEPAVIPTPELLPSLRARLEAQARGFCVLRSGGKKELVASSVDVVMRGSEELSFYLTYPAADKSPLRFEMTVLNRIEEGNAITLEVLDGTRKQLEKKSLTRENSAIEVSLPAMNPEPVK